MVQKKRFFVFEDEQIELNDFETDKLIMDLFASLSKKERKKFIESLTKKEKELLLAMIRKRMGVL